MYFHVSADIKVTIDKQEPKYKSLIEASANLLNLAHAEEITQDVSDTEKRLRHVQERWSGLEKYVDAILRWNQSKMVPFLYTCHKIYHIGWKIGEM